MFLTPTCVIFNSVNGLLRLTKKLNAIVTSVNSFLEVICGQTHGRCDTSTQFSVVTHRRVR